MAVRNWHFGKIVLMWAWGVVLVAVTFQLVERTEHFVFGFTLIGVLIAIPVTLSVITWKWLSGKEQ